MDIHVGLENKARIFIGANALYSGTLNFSSTCIHAAYGYTDTPLAFFCLKSNLFV